MNVRIFEPGVTTTEGFTAFIGVEVGTGPLGSDPRTSPEWTWEAIGPDREEGDDDVYASMVEAPTVNTPTAVSLAARVTFAGVNFTFCDRDGAGKGA